MTSAPVPLPRIRAAEFFGGAFLPAVVIGAGGQGLLPRQAAASRCGSVATGPPSGCRVQLSGHMHVRHAARLPWDADQAWAQAWTRQLRQEAATGR